MNPIFPLLTETSAGTNSSSCPLMSCYSWLPAHIPSHFSPFSPFPNPKDPPVTPWNVDLAPSHGHGLPQTSLLPSLWSHLGSCQGFPNSRHLQIPLDQAWREEAAELSGKKELYGNSGAGNQTFGWEPIFWRLEERRGSPKSMGQSKWEQSRRRVRLVPVCLVRSTSHT